MCFFLGKSAIFGVELGLFWHRNSKVFKNSRNLYLLIKTKKPTFFFHGIDLNFRKMVIIPNYKIKIKTGIFII